MTHKNIRGIQVLRGIAALLVGFHHSRASVPQTQGWPEFGASGVDIFFVISGFVMAHATRRIGDDPLMRRVRNAIGFLAKRVLRVVHLYWLALLWTSRRALSNGVVHPRLVNNFLFIPRFTPVYPDMLWPSVIQGWTLNYEMFFYALFGASLLVGRARFRILIALLLALVAFRFSPFATETLTKTSSIDFGDIGVRFYTNNIMLEFVYGILLQRVLSSAHPPQCPRAAYVLMMCLGFGLLTVGFGHEPRGLLVGIPALLIVWAAIPVFPGRAMPKWQAIGDASYATYLFHWASFGAVNPIANKIQISAGVHRLLERPLMRGMEFGSSYERSRRPLDPALTLLNPRMKTG